MAEYIERDSIYSRVKTKTNPYGKPTLDYESGVKVLDMIKQEPAADVAPVVRCKDCKWFVPKHILMDDGSTREYTEEEKKLPLGVPGNVGINCGSRCMRQISWLENSVPVWVQENDFCSYGERKEATP